MPPVAQPTHAVPCGNGQHEAKQYGFKQTACNLIPIVDAFPPIDQESANAARRRGHVVRQPRPSLKRVDARNGLEQIGGKIPSANVLNVID
jgi:hypothetical protein